MVLNRRISVHIDQLRLVGMSERRPEALRTALAAELEILLGAGDITDQWTRSTHIDSITGPLPSEHSGPALGRAVARSLMEGLNRPNSAQERP